MKYYNYPNGTEVAENVDSRNISEFAPKELPAIAAGDAGKTVKVNAAGTGIEYGDPELPSTASLENGTYVLKATKTSSGVTFTWVADTANNEPEA